jgi:hypothetical protein
MGPTNGYKLTRREWLKLGAAGVLGGCMSGWLERLAHAAADDKKRQRSCILLWMSGGPSTIDLWDLKPGHANGGPFKEIDTTAPGLKISEHLPKLAKLGEHLAVVRSMTTKEADHGRGTHLMHTGYLPLGGLRYPTLGGIVAKELGENDCVLPNFVSIAPYRFFSPAAYSSGFLGPQHEPLIIADGYGAFGPQNNNQDPYFDKVLKVKDVQPRPGTAKEHQEARLELLEGLEKDFAARRPDAPAASHQTAYDKAVRLMRTSASKAFDLEEEKAAVRDSYGKSLFGQSCLLARRLVEHGVPFIEVNLGGVNGGAFGWDTHNQNFQQVKQLSGALDDGWSALMTDLKDRGLLDTTTIVWMGEFGRTPKINGGQGRDHWANSWATVLAGGGIKGGQAYGKTSADGMEIADKPTTAADFMATVVTALGISHTTPNRSNLGRPITIADKGSKPIKDIVG